MEFPQPYSANSAVQPKASVFHELVKYITVNCVIKIVEWIDPSKVNLLIHNNNDPVKFN